MVPAGIGFSKRFRNVSPHSRQAEHLLFLVSRLGVYILHPTVHHFLIARGTPPYDFRRIRIPGIICGVVVVRRDDEPAALLDMKRILESVGFLPLETVVPNV